MDRAAMRSLMESILGLEGALDTSDANAHLDRNYQFSLPHRIGGAALEGYVEFSTVASTDTYNLDTIADADGGKIARNVFQPFVNTVSGRHLEVSDQPIPFFWRHRHEDGSTGDPVAALLRSRSITLRPVPSGVYTFRIYGTVYRGALDDGGIADDAEAMCVVAMACQDFAVTDERVESAQRAQILIDKYFPIVMAKYLARTSEPITQHNVEGGHLLGGF